MSLYTVSNGNTIQAADMLQVLDIVQRRSGQTEVGHYFLAGNASANAQLASTNVLTRSRKVTPASVTVDQADTAPSGGFTATPSTTDLTAGGVSVQEYTDNLGAHLNAIVGGNITFTF